MRNLGKKFIKILFGWTGRILLVLILALFASSYVVDYEAISGTVIGKTITTNPDLENGLVGHWTFDGGDFTGTSTIIDRSGSGNNGIFKGECASSSAYATIISDLSPELNWNLTDDGNDDSGNGHNVISTVGSPTFTATFIPCAPYTNAMLLDADEGYEYADSTVINTYTTPAGDYFAISLWFQPSSNASGNGNVIYEQGGNSNSLAVYTYDNSGTDEIYCAMVEGALYDFVSAEITVGDYHHLGCVWDVDDDEMSMYLDGKLVDLDTSLAVGADLAAHSSDINLGSIDFGGEPDNHLGSVMAATFQGSIADVAFWGVNDDGAVDETNFLAIYEAGVGGAAVLKAVPGRIGQALFFDDTDDEVIIPDDSAISGLSAVTVSVWFNATSWNALANVNDYLVAKTRYNTQREYRIRHEEQGGSRLVWHISNDGNDPGSAEVELPISDFPVGEWHHVVATYDDNDGDALKLYHDGVLGDTGVGESGGTFDGSSDLGIGGLPIDTQDNFHGSIDDVRIFDRALSQAEITRLYQLGATTHIGVTLNNNPSLESGLVGHWTFDGKDYDIASTTAEILDRSGSANHGDVQDGSGNTGEIHYQNTESNSCGNSGTCTITGFTLASSSGNNRLVVVGASCKWDCNVSDVTFDGVSGRLVEELDDISGTTVTASQWYFLDSDLPSTAGDYDIVMTSSPTENQSVGALAFGGVDQSKAMVASSSNGTCFNCDDRSSTVTTVDDNSIVVNVVQTINTNNLTANNSIIETYEEDPGGTGGGGYKFVASEGSATGGFDFSAQQTRAVHMISAYSPAPAPGNFVPGRIGQGYNFSTVDGADDAINVGSASELDLDGPITIAMWAKLNVDQGSDTLLAQGVVGAADRFSTDSTAPENNAIEFMKDATGDNLNVHSTNEALVAGEWRHIAMTWDGGLPASGVVFYSNGVDIGQGAGQDGTGTLSTGSTEDVIIGNRDELDDEMNADLDDVRVYDRVLSAEEIKRLYQMGATTNISKTLTPSLASLATGLIGHWTFDGKDMVTNIADVSGSGNDGILEGNESTSTGPGVLGQAIDLDGNAGSNARIFISGLMGTPTDVSACSWINLKGIDTSANNSQLFGIGDYFGMTLQTEGTNKVRAYWYENPGWNNTGNTAGNLIDTGWHHVCGTFDDTANEQYTYLDGAVLSSNTSASSISYTGQGTDTRIGRNGNYNDRNWDGLIDDFRMYNRALSAAEVLFLYKMGRP